MSYRQIGGSRAPGRLRLVMGGRRNGLAGCELSEMGEDGACPDGTFDYNFGSLGNGSSGSGGGVNPCGPGYVWNSAVSSCDPAGAAGGSASLSQFLMSMANKGLDIVNRVVAPTYQRDASGKVVYRAPTSNQATSLVGRAGSMPGWVWIAGGVGLVAIVAMSKKK